MMHSQALRLNKIVAFQIYEELKDKEPKAKFQLAY